MTEQSEPELIELALLGDLTEHENDFTEKLLSVPPGSECSIYINCPGGSPYVAASMVSLLRLRNIHATAIVTGECSSAAIWPFAACQRRLITPHSVFLFHPMRWQSEEHVHHPEAAEWVRHFGHLEKSMDRMLAELFDVPLEKLAPWIRPGRYVLASELAEAGLAEIVELRPLPEMLDSES